MTRTEFLTRLYKLNKYMSGNPQFADWYRQMLNKWHRWYDALPFGGIFAVSEIVGSGDVGTLLLWETASGPGPMGLAPIRYIPLGLTGKKH